MTWTSASDQSPIRSAASGGTSESQRLCAMGGPAATVMLLRGSRRRTSERGIRPGPVSDARLGRDEARPASARHWRTDAANCMAGNQRGQGQRKASDGQRRTCGDVEGCRALLGFRVSRRFPAHYARECEQYASASASWSSSCFEAHGEVCTCADVKER